MAKRKLPNDHAEGGADWGNEEKLALLQAMKEQCPDPDKLSFTARVSKVDWQKISVEGRTAEQCHEAWVQLSAKIRKFRTLGELMEDAKDMVLHPEKHQDKKHKLKHPDQPVKPLTPFFQYLQDVREKVKSEHPDVKHLDLTRIISQQWQTMEPSKQNKYIRRYKKKWEKFQAANAKFLEEHPELNSRQPKPRPPTPFSLYVKAKMPGLKEKHPEMDRATIQKKMKTKYMKLSPKKKKKWIQRAKDAVPNYEEEIRHYQMHHPDFEPPTKKVKLTREEAKLTGEVNEVGSKGAARKKRVAAFPGAPVKPPRSAFQLYVKKHWTVEGSLQEKMRVLGQQWHQLGPKQGKYTKKLDKLRQTYQQELQTFKEALTAEELAQFEQSLQPKSRMVTKARTATKAKQENQVNHNIAQNEVDSDNNARSGVDGDDASERSFVTL